MSKRLCRCGAIVESRCERCDKPDAMQKTAERGYDNRWRTLSERYRIQNPICQVCEWFYERDGRLPVRPAEHVHHIVKISEDKTQRLEHDNLLAVCEACHEWIEDRKTEARQVKDWHNARDSRQEWR